MEYAPFNVICGNERLITPSGLAIVGLLLRQTELRKRLNQLGQPKGYTHLNYECFVGYLGLLCQGKTGFEDMREMQEDPSYYKRALQMGSVPSAETVRQRLDELGGELVAGDQIMEVSAQLLKRVGINPTPTFTGHVVLDVDVSVHDNSKTKKEGVERTYLGMDGYAPIYAYLGEEGYLCNVELRNGKCHSQNGTVDFMEKTIPLARQTTSKKLLVRMDSGNDALDNIKLFVKEEVDYLIKRNQRKESAQEWFAVASQIGAVSTPRKGKTVYTGSLLRDRGLEQPLRIVFQVTERTMLANGQILLEPEIDVQTWWTSLTHTPEEVIRLYREHATSEQFHSEMKNDLGLERFPSSHFDTNAAVLKLAALAFNVLRVIGQTALSEETKLTRHEVSRLRIKTVINRLILIAGHVIQHARQNILSLGRSNIWSNSFLKVYGAFL